MPKSLSADFVHPEATSNESDIYDIKDFWEGFYSGCPKDLLFGWELLRISL